MFGLRQKSSDSSDFPRITNINKVWHLVERPKIKAYIERSLQYESSLLIRGMPGVGKTVYVRHVVNVWIQSQSKQPIAHFLDGIQLAADSI